MFKYGFPTYWTTLKKLIWLYATKLKNKFKKLIVSGVSPLSLVNAAANNIVSLIQYGKCEQSSTPTPISPVDIYCNNGKLVMVDDELPSEYKRVLGFQCDNNAMWKITDFHLKGSDTVRVAFSVSSACNVWGCYQSADSTDNYDLYATITAGGKYLRYGNGTYASYFSSENQNKRFDVVYTPTGSIGMPEDSTWSALNFTSANDLLIGSTTITGTSSKLKGNLYGDFVVENGGAERLHLIPCERVSDNVLGYYDKVGETFYEPYTGFDRAVSLGYDDSHYELAVVGTPEAIEVIPCGAWDATDNAVAQGTIASVDGQDGGTSTSRVRTRGYMTVEPNTEYTISTNLGGIYLFQYAEDKSYLGTSVASGWKSSPYTFTTNASCAFVRATLAKTYPATSASVSPSDCKYVQVIKGSSAVKQTASAENLFAVVGYADTQEIIGGSVNRKNGVVVLTGEENIGVSNACFTVPISDRTASKTELLCSHFPYSNKTSSQTNDQTIISFASTNIGFRYDACADKTAFAAWLADQYAAGTPVIVVYPLATPTTEQVTPQSLSTDAGDNVLLWTAEVSDKTMSAIYIEGNLGTSNKVGIGKVGYMKI